LVLNIMASIAEFERELIAARMAEGRQRAMDNGVKFGPPFKLDTFQKREALARIKAGESQSLIARTHGVDRAPSLACKSAGRCHDQGNARRLTSLGRTRTEKVRSARRHAILTHHK